MSGIINSTGARSGVIGTTVGTPAGGVTEVDQWGLRSNPDSTGYLTTQWARSSNAGLIGTGLGYATSSGRFSFPSTGVWLIINQFDFTTTGSDDYIDIELHVTTNDSSYVVWNKCQIGNSQDNHIVTQSNCIDVTDIANVKFKWYLSSMDSSELRAESSNAIHRSGFVVIRLGDT